MAIAQSHSSGSWAVGAPRQASAGEVGMAVAVAAGLGAALLAPGLLPVVGGLVVASIVAGAVKSMRSEPAAQAQPEMVAPAFHAVLPPREALDLEKLAARRREQARMIAEARPDPVAHAKAL